MYLDALAVLALSITALVAVYLHDTKKSPTRRANGEQAVRITRK